MSVKNLLDNEQIKDIQDTAEMAAQTFDTIGRNNEPFGLIIASAACRAGPLFFRAMGDEMKDVSKGLADLAYSTAERLEAINDQD